MLYSCNRCGKVVKSPRGLNLHIKACRVEYGLASHTFPSRSEYSCRQGSFQPRKLHGQPKNTSLETPYRTYSGPATLPDTEEGVWNGILNIHNEALGNDDDHDRDREYGNTSIVHSSGRASLISVVKTATYSIVTRKRAGHGTLTVDPHTSNKRVSAFHTRFGLHLAKWLYEANCSQSSIDKLFKDKELEVLHRLLQYDFRNGKEWLNVLSGLNMYMQPYLPNGVYPRTDRREESEFFIKKTLSNGRGVLLYRSIMDYVHFILGFRPYAAQLVYEPIRDYNSNNQRVFSELHTGDWWWEQNDRVKDNNATIVPLIFHTDKTQLTQIQGDLKAWPVYVSVGNLPAHIRRQKGPGHFLVAMLPVSIDRDGWHEAMAEVTQEIIPHSLEGVNVQCADGRTRRCYPTICIISGDYEEQVLVTAVKKNIHCPVCLVPPKKRHCLFPVHEHGANEPAIQRPHQRMQQWELRTHENTKHRITRVQNSEVIRTSDDFVHPHTSFVWSHHRVNVHQAIAVDILHQIHSGIVKRIFGWILEELDHYGTDGTQEDSRWTAKAQVASAFRSVSHFFELKVFKHRTPCDLTQWSGKDSKALLQQMVAVLAPFLEHVNPWLLRFVKALTDFAVMAAYRSHDESVLLYMEQALQIMDVLKSAFVTKCETSFNFPKWHSLSHYTNNIRLYGSPSGYSTDLGESYHLRDVKSAFKRTNKRADYPEQIMRQTLINFRNVADNIEEAFGNRFRDLALLQPLNACRASPADYDDTTTTVRPGKARSARTFVQDIMDCDASIDIGEAPIPTGTWITVEMLGRLTGIANLASIVGAFVTEERAMLKSERTGIPNTLRDKLTTAARDADGFSVSVHYSLRVPRLVPGEEGEPKQTTGFVRCAPNWQRTKQWRRDHVWLQEFDDNTDGSLESILSKIGSDLNAPDVSELRMLKGTRIGQLQLILTVRDPGPDNQGYVREYCGVLVKVFECRGGGRPLEVAGLSKVPVKLRRQLSEKLKKMVTPGNFHGLVELTPRAPSKADMPSKLGPLIMYSLDYVIRAAHVVSCPKPFSRTDGKRWRTTANDGQRWQTMANDGERRPIITYVNPYSNLDDYNDLYWPDYETEPAETIRKFRAAKWIAPKPNARTAATIKRKATVAMRRQATQTQDVGSEEEEEEEEGDVTARVWAPSENNSEEGKRRKVMRRA